jgi:hypothetical protein
MIICELLGRKDFAVEITGKLGSLLPNAEEVLIDPKAEEPPQTTFEPVSNFGEKRVLPITNKTVVLVRKTE